MNTTNIKNKLAKSSNAVVSYVKGVSGLMSGLVIVFVLLVIGIIVYYIYIAVQKSASIDSDNPVLIGAPMDATDLVTPNDTSKHNAFSWVLPSMANTNSPSLTFTLSFWMFVSNWKYRNGIMKAILVKGNSSNTYGDNNYSTTNNDAPGIYLHPNTNMLVIRTAILNSSADSTTPTFQYCNISNFPLQKWVNVTIVFDNRILDTYIDGKLERSCVLKNIMVLNNKKLFLFPPSADGTAGYMGQFAGLHYFSSSLKPVDVARIYSQGYNALNEYSTLAPDGATKPPST